MKRIRALLYGTAVVVVLASRANVRADNLAEAAAKASALVKRPIAASPHALEEFPWLLREAYADNLAVAAHEAPALVKRPIVTSPHGLEEFPWLLRGSWPQTPATGQAKNPLNPRGAAAKPPGGTNRPILPGTHRGDYP